MKLHLERALGEYRITGYQAGGIVVNDAHYTQSIIVAPDQAPRTWELATLSGAASDAFEPLFEGAPEVVLIGTGPVQLFPETTLLTVLFGRGVGVEFMDTAAACRTFNIVAGEGRRVVAGLLPLTPT